MTLLLRDPDVRPGDPGAATAPEPRACPKCQAPLAPGQDWCLDCGQAQPGRLAGLPGKRAAATVFALTTLLVGGAVAASYAALQDKGAAPVTPPTQVAQTPQPVAPAPTAPAPPAASTATPAPTDTTTVPPAAGAVPPTPPPASSPAAPAPSTPPTSAPTSKGSTPGGTGSTGGTPKPGTTAHPRTTTPPLSAASPMKLAADAVALYDPYKRDSAAGDPAKAHDGDPNTSFPVTVAEGSPKIGAGLVVDLGAAAGLRELDLTVKTPGFRVEIYATDSAELPPDVLDTRWAHLKDVSDVGVDNAGKQRIVLGGGATKYRHVLLWVTTPPKDGTTVRVSELKALG